MVVKNFIDGTRLFFVTADTAPNPIDTSGAVDYYVINSTGISFKNNNCIW